MLKRILIAVMLTVLGASSFAAPAPTKTKYAEARLISAVEGVQPGQKFWVALHLKLKKGWHSYWKNPGDSGLAPTIEWTLPNGFTPGDIHYTPPEKQKSAGLINFGYSDDVYYLVPIDPPAILRENASYIFSAKASWLVCEEICVPESADLALVLTSNLKEKPRYSADYETLAEQVSNLPKPTATPLSFRADGAQIRIDLPEQMQTAAKNAERVVFFPEQMGIVDVKQDVMLLGDDGHMQIALPQLADKHAADLKSGLLSVFTGKGDETQRLDFNVQLEYMAGAFDMRGGGKLYDVLQAVLFAFLGGLILNAMPCVFPVLSLKAFSIAKKAGSAPAQVKLIAVFYTLGVVLTFMGLALLLISIQQVGISVGWGFQMQSPLFVGALAYLMFALALNMSGYFEIPVLLGGAGGDISREEKPVSSFLTGVLAVTVATPCTAPFMGAAMGFAFLQPPHIVLLIFFALGLGMAFPFLLICLFPKLVSKLPKPGLWMQRFKEFLAFPLYITVIWLIWVIAQQTPVGHFAWILLGMLGIVFALWLWHAVREKTPGWKVIAIILSIVFVVPPLLMLPLSGVNTQAPSAVKGRGAAFSPAALEALRKEGKPVFVNATAAWCITCQVNDRVALSSETLWAAFEKQGIAYMVADWTNYNDDITKYLESFDRRGVPIYVYYPPKGEPVVLPQILTESIVLEAIGASR